MRPPLYFPIEMGTRELGPRLLTAAIAAERGFEVLLGFQHTLFNNADQLPAGIYLSKGTNNFFLRRVPGLRAFGHSFVACEEESFGFVMEQSPLTFNSSQLSHNCDLYLCLGRDEDEYIHRRFGKDFPTALTGNARVDLLRPALRALYNREVGEIKKKFGKFILFNTNFGLINSSAGFSMKDWFAKWTEAGVFPGDDVRENAAKFNEFVEWENGNAVGIRTLLGLVAGSGDHQIILRPHPTENGATWKAVAEEMGLTNVQVLEGTPHVPFMLASEIAVHPGCTTGIEALILGVPTLSLRMGESPVHDFYLCNRTNVTAASAEEALRLIEDHCRGGDGVVGSRDRLMAVLGEYLEDMTVNVLTADKIVDAIEGFSTRRNFDCDSRNLGIVQWRHAQTSNRPYFRQKFDIDEQKIQKTLAGFQTTLNRFDTVKVKSVSDMIYHISGSDSRAAA